MTLAAFGAYLQSLASLPLPWRFALPALQAALGEVSLKVKGELLHTTFRLSASQADEVLRLLWRENV